MKIVKIAVVAFVVLAFIGSLLPDTPSEVAQETTSVPVTPAPTPPAPTPPAAPETPPVTTGGYGDDPELDALWDLCEQFDYEACEELYWNSPLGSEYETYALSMLDMMDEGLDERGIVDLLGPDALMDLVWNQTDKQGQVELCLGYGLLGGIAAGTIISESSGGLVTPEEAADWLKGKCE